MYTFYPSVLKYKTNNPTNSTKAKILTSSEASVNNVNSTGNIPKSFDAKSVQNSEEDQSNLNSNNSEYDSSAQIDESLDDYEDPNSSKTGKIVGLSFTSILIVTSILIFAVFMYRRHQKQQRLVDMYTSDMTLENPVRFESEF